MIDGSFELRTLAAEIGFRTKSGRDLDCRAAKITPCVCTTSAVPFTYLPAGVMALVSVSSWQGHLSQLGTSSLLGYASVFTSGGIAWDTAVDVSDYLRYFQFAFLTSALSLEYPGFYHPIISKVAWSSLLYWQGPFKTSWRPENLIEGGYYTANVSYGINNMMQVMGYPLVHDMVLAAFLNFAIMAAAIFLIACCCCWLSWRRSQVVKVLSVLRAAALFSGGISMLFFSVPLLFFLSTAFEYIRYYPAYRIALVVVVLVAILVTFWAIQRHLNKSRRSAPRPLEKQSFSCMANSVRSRFWDRLHCYLPVSIPLIQAVVINILQWSGKKQVLFLAASEAVLFLHMAWLLRGKAFTSNKGWCSAARLITAGLQVVFAAQATEATNQWVGYIILSVHAAIIFVAYPWAAIWRLYRVFQKRRRDKLADSAGKSGNQPVSPSCHSLCAWDAR